MNVNVRQYFPPETRHRMRRLIHELHAVGHGSDLNRLATIYGTDKWGAHFYTQHYQRYFEPIRSERLKILEIGVGGYGDLLNGAQSLRMWKRFFPNSHVVGIDIYDKSHFSEDRITVLQADQTDNKRMREIVAQYGPFDIVIDDGSHLNEHVIATFGILFPLLKSPGFYCIEDLQTAYWQTWGATKGSTSLDFLRSLIDGLNHSEIPQYQASETDLTIKEIAFFHNLCIVRKEPNIEPCNVPEELAKQTAPHRKHG